jgi:hypothetical protein
LKDGDKNRIRLKQWGEEGDLVADEAAYQRQAAINEATKPADISYSKEEMKDWEPYAPDLSIGAPGEDQLAAFLRDKAHRLPGNNLRLSWYVREAEGINPNINTETLLVDFCVKQGWTIGRNGTSPVVYIP